MDGFGRWRELNSCGRHECGRQCCPLSYKAKNKKKNRLDDDIDDEAHVCPLVCGKLLSCGLHSCPKPDHKGSCGKCLQASYDEVRFWSCPKRQICNT